MKYSSSKEFDLLIKKAGRLGGVKNTVNFGYHREESGADRASTPSDFRAFLNFRSDLRRAMMIWLNTFSVDA